MLNIEDTKGNGYIVLYWIILKCHITKYAFEKTTLNLNMTLNTTLNNRLRKCFCYPIVRIYVYVYS